jgi:rare lipoprotein A
MKSIIFTLILFTLQAQASQVGMASWYGSENKRSSTGKKLINNTPAAAHRTLPIGTKVKITSIKTHKSIIVVIEDRGPFTKKRIVDLNKMAAKQLGIIKQGITRVILEIVTS